MTLEEHQGEILTGAPSIPIPTEKLLNPTDEMRLTPARVNLRATPEEWIREDADHPCVKQLKSLKSQGKLNGEAYTKMRFEVKEMLKGRKRKAFEIEPPPRDEIERLQRQAEEEKKA